MCGFVSTRRLWRNGFDMFRDTARRGAGVGLIEGDPQGVA